MAGTLPARGRSACVLACARGLEIAAANWALVSANLTAATRAMKRTFFGDLRGTPPGDQRFPRAELLVRKPRVYPEKSGGSVTERAPKGKRLPKFWARTKG